MGDERTVSAMPTSLTTEQTERVRNVIANYVASNKPVLDSHDLTSKFGFGDGDMFSELVSELEAIPALAELLPDTTSHDLIAAVAHLVLLPALEKETPGVELVHIATAHNPVRIARVGALSENEASLHHCSVELTAEQLFAALEHALGDEKFTVHPFTRPSTLTDGMRGLVDRRVVVQIGDDEDSAVTAQLIDVTNDALILGGFDSWGGDFVKVIPLATVRAVSSYQLTQDEQERLAGL